MTTNFYPIGSWNQPQGVYQTMYQSMMNPGNLKRSEYMVGYAGHQPEVKFKFGYGHPGPDVRQPREFVPDADPQVPEPWDRHEMRQTAMSSAEQGQTTGRKLAMPRPESVPAQLNRPRHTSRALDHYFPRSVEPGCADGPKCAAQYILRNPCGNDGQKPLMRSSSHMAFAKKSTASAQIDHEEPVTYPLGGTGFDACAGIVNNWWPRYVPVDGERRLGKTTGFPSYTGPGKSTGFPSYDQEAMLKEKYRTSFRSTYTAKAFHRPLIKDQGDILSQTARTEKSHPAGRETLRSLEQWTQ
jgi:hypothetical protein